MNYLILTIDEERFIVHFKDEGSEAYKMKWSGSLLPLVDELDNGTWEYMHKDTCEPTKDIMNSLVWFDWTFCWRGVWEGRVYFKNEEFWGEDVAKISQVWKIVEETFKQKIKDDNPDYKYFDR